MRALIVDDERLARSELRRLLKEHSAIDIVGEAANDVQARQKIEAERPDLIFLDVQMPGQSGFDLLASLIKPPRVIFTTAYDDYALKAFEFGAYDYLLKPVDPSRLAQAIARLQERSGGSVGRIDARVPSSGRLREADQVFLQDGEHCWLVRVGNIRIFESEGNYARAYFDKNTPLILRSLRSLADRLDPQLFVRTSRQHLINLRFVQRIEPWFDGGLMVSLSDGDPKIKVARRRAYELRERLRI